MTSLSPCRFRVEHWFQFPSDLESCNPGIDDDNKELMVEGLLTLILTVLSCRLHCGKFSVTHAFHLDTAVVLKVNLFVLTVNLFFETKNVSVQVLIYSVRHRIIRV